MTMISLQVVNRKKAIWRISRMIGSQLNSISNRCMRCSTRSDLQFKCDCICNLDGALMMMTMMMMMMQLLLRDYCYLHVDSVRCVSCSSRIVVESCAWSCCLKLALFVREAACRTRLRSKLQLLLPPATCVWVRHDHIHFRFLISSLLESLSARSDSLTFSCSYNPLVKLLFFLLATITLLTHTHRDQAGSARTCAREGGKNRTQVQVTQSGYRFAQSRHIWYIIVWDHVSWNVGTTDLDSGLVGSAGHGVSWWDELL